MKSDIVILFAYSWRYVLGDDRNVRSAMRGRQAPRHPHLARKLRIVGLKRHKLNYTFVRNEFDEPPFNDIGVR